MTHASPISSPTTDGKSADGSRDLVCGTPHVFEILSEEHALQRELCDLLEVIADGLPHTFDRGRAVVAVSLLEGALPAHTRLEEEALFPAIARRLPASHPVIASLSVLEEDHAREEAALAEVTEALQTAIANPASTNMEALGYVLRGLFDSLRRHLDFEDRVVVPTAREALTADDHVDLQGWIMRSEHPRCCKQSLMDLRRVKAGEPLCGTCPSAIAQDQGAKAPVERMSAPAGLPS